MTDDEVPALDDHLCFALYSAANAITRAYRARLAQLDLTYPQYLVLMVLWQQGPATVTEIARRLRLNSHAISPVVNRLAARGLVQRAPRRAGDLRRVDLSLTASGRELHAPAAEVQRAVALETGLQFDEAVALRNQLDAVSRRLAGAAGLDTA